MKRALLLSLTVVVAVSATSCGKAEDAPVATSGAGNMSLGSRGGATGDEAGGAPECAGTACSILAGQGGSAGSLGGGDAGGAGQGGEGGEAASVMPIQCATKTCAPGDVCVTRRGGPQGAGAVSGCVSWPPLCSATHDCSCQSLCGSSAFCTLTAEDAFTCDMQ